MSTIAISHSPVRARRSPSRPAPARPAPVSGELRLTRRGRFVVFVGALLVILAMAFWWGTGSAATERAEQTETIVVGSGDTLWGIADEVASEGEVADMVARIKDLNGLERGGLQAGQRLEVPVTP